MEQRKGYRSARGREQRPPRNAMKCLNHWRSAVLIALALGCWCSSPTLAQSSDASALGRRVSELIRAHKYAEAIPLAQRTLAIREKTLGPNHLDVALSLNNLAFLYANQGPFGEAEQLYKRALTIREKARGPQHPEVATTLNNLASLYRKLGRFSEAEPLHKRALAIREKALGPNHPDVAQSLNNLAGLYKAQGGRDGEVEALYKRSLAIREKAVGPNHTDVALALNNLAGLYKKDGRFAEAEPLLKRALAIRERIFGANHPAVALELNNLAGLYGSQARYAEAEQLYKRALALYEKAGTVYGPQDTSIALELGNLAWLYHKQGRFSEAEPLYKRALALREKIFGPEHFSIGKSLNELAGMYSEQGRYDEAEPLYKRALAIREKALGAEHRDVAFSLIGLAELYVKQARYTEAEPLMKRGLAIRENVLGANHSDVAWPLNHLAELYRDQGRHAEAEPLVTRALAIRERIYGVAHPEVAQSLDVLASIQHSQARYDDAEPLYKRAVAIREKLIGPNHRDVAIVLNNLAKLHSDQDRTADALPFVQRLIREHRSPKYPALAVLWRADSKKLVDPSEALINSFEVVQRATSTAAGEAVSKLAARFAAGNDELAKLVRDDQDLLVEERSKDKELTSAFSNPAAERSAANEDRLRKRLAEIKAERDRLQKVFNQRFPDYVALSNPQPVSVRDAQALLADDEALVVFDFGATSYAWVITRTAADWTELKITSQHLETEVKRLRDSITAPFFVPFDSMLAYKIYQATFGAVADRLTGKKRLSIVTNAALTSLPPQLLVVTDPTHKALKDVDWLTRSYAITILPTVASMKVLRGMSKTSTASKPMIAFADPVFSKAERMAAQEVKLAMAHTEIRSILRIYRGTKLDVAKVAELLPQLPGTRTEVQAITKVLKVDPGDTKVGLAATETAVKQAKLNQYRIVYFATHGLVSGDLDAFAKAETEPALALTIPDNPTELDDGLLLASEAAQLKLDADWVVLSACNTAAENKPGAEPLSGLARAFFYAGARSLIVSHWPVDDLATADLMAKTFQLYAQRSDLSHAQALQQAVLQMIEQARSDREAHPRLWAPFVVVGEPAKRFK